MATSSKSQTSPFVRARAHLVERPDAEPHALRVLGAALLAAVAAVMMAGVVVLGPGFEIDPITQVSGR